MSAIQMTSLQKARARLLMQNPFFGTILVSTPLIARDDIPTAATDMTKIYYNPAFFAELTVPQIVFVLAHEVMHMALEHGFRRNGRDPHLFNVACDYAINLILQDCNMELVKGVLIDPKYRGLNAEQIYALLEQEAASKPKPGNPGQPGNNPQPGGGQPGSDQQPGGGLASDLMEPDTSDPEAYARAKDELRGKIMQASTMTRLAGQMSGELGRAIEGILNPPVPWPDLLRPYMQQVVRNNESWSRRNRRFSNVYLPDRYDTQLGPVAIIGDTSGSISNKEIAAMAGIVATIAEEVSPERIHMVWADTKVAGEQTFERGENIKPDPKGGGGTDMRVPLAHVEQYAPEVVVLITDGHTPWPAVEPDFPLIVVCTTNQKVPVGEVVRV